MQRTRWATLVVAIAGCKGAEPETTPVPPIAGDPCPIDFDLAKADAWPGCPEGGPVGIERTYFAIGTKPCRIVQKINDVPRSTFALTWGTGGRLERIKVRDHVTTNHYDAGGRWVSTDDVEPPDPPRTITYERDPQGRLVAADDGAWRTNYTRDASGNITTIDQFHGNDRSREVISYANGVAVAAENRSVFAGKRRITTFRVERDANGRRTRSIRETRADDGEPVEMTDDIKFKYDAAGRLTSMLWVNDLGNAPDETEITATYDTAGRLTSLAENAIVLSFGYDCR